MQTNSDLETLALGKRLAQHLFPGAIILLSGCLGAGKTVLAQGIGAGLGIEEAVTSPTFTIVQEYSSGRLPFFHADLYRVESPEELEEIGFTEYWQREGVTLIEWPERLGYLVPEEYLAIKIAYCDSTQRQIAINALGSSYQQIVDNLQARA